MLGRGGKGQGGIGGGDEGIRVEVGSAEEVAGAAAVAGLVEAVAVAGKEVVVVAGRLGRRGLRLCSRRPNKEVVAERVAAEVEGICIAEGHALAT
ncbi:hypothetical protein CYMTET_49669 [Cymbomonas tetramitiformis]|uniref:Uncharacterized protein n=1 Tax=Cymbomonas tetramitiformis TaxID=36881 RepID=A0AAE0BRP9_9CHLO|nr:hypothetical protein CYMTET_49669 [Cymbomonas tetramitiformis]